MNHSRLYFTDISADGILNTGALTNGADGIIYISTAHDDGLDNSGTITNLNSIIIENVDDSGVWNGGKFINEAGGVIAISNALDGGLVNSTDTLQNNGQIYITKSQDGITNSGLLTNTNSITIDSIDKDGFFNFGAFINQAHGSIFISNTEGNGMENIAGFMVRNSGEIDINKAGESCLENSGTIENHNLMKIGYSSLSSVYNVDSIYNGPGAIIEICCNTSNKYGFENYSITSALTNEGFLDVSGSQPIYNEGSINNNGKTLIDGFNTTGIHNAGVIINTDSIVIEEGWNGIFQDKIFDNVSFRNDGYCSISNLGGDAINLARGAFTNNGIVQIDAVGKGVYILPTSEFPAQFHNLVGANITINESRNYGVHLGIRAELINESGSFLHIINTTETPLEVEDGASLEGYSEIIIEH